MTVSKHETPCSPEATKQVNDITADFIAEALNSADENEQIKGCLGSQSLARLGMKPQYTHAKTISLITAQLTLNDILSNLAEHEIYTNMLAHRNSDSFAPSLKSFIRYLPGHRDKIKQLNDFFETEYFKIDPELKVMPPYLRERIRSYQTLELHLEKCKEQLLYATVIFSSPELLSSMTHIPLKEIANAHNNSYLDLLIGREALRRAETSTSYVELATDLLMPRDISYSQPTSKLENEDESGLNKKQLATDIKSFVKKHGEFQVKCQLIKSAIERKLLSADTLTPWTLGWTGSRSTITFDEKNFNVPQGIFELYQLVQFPKENENKIKELISEKQPPVKKMHGFFRSMTGTTRSDETQETYEELNFILVHEY
ncbi:hypothetical protein ACD661_08315 [Legionella lytica]|uniref:Uncharacterized protein n=1 Tax=Legionella lytica TaxID=96232 RepID=A0ABW8D777_9GAMM